MENNNIPLRNLNNEERQTNTNPIPPRNSSSSRQDESLFLCAVGIAVAIFFVGIAYAIGSSSCKNN